ncbi:MAG: hypothetical protein ACKOB4_01880 [Acidobacteriota bacterium]
MERREEPEVRGETYPDSVRKLSENWRQLRPEERRPLAGAEAGSRLSKYYLPIGLGIGVLVVGLLVVIGGLAFLIWNGGR